MGSSQTKDFPLFSHENCLFQVRPGTSARKSAAGPASGPPTGAPAAYHSPLTTDYALRKGRRPVSRRPCPPPRGASGRRRRPVDRPGANWRRRSGPASQVRWCAQNLQAQCKPNRAAACKELRAPMVCAREDERRQIAHVGAHHPDCVRRHGQESSKRPCARPARIESARMVCAGLVKKRKSALPRAQNRGRRLRARRVCEGVCGCVDVCNRARLRLKPTDACGMSGEPRQRSRLQPPRRPLQVGVTPATKPTAPPWP